MGFLLAVSCLICLDVVAEDIVNLEPTFSPNSTNVFGCYKWNNSEAGCNASPYCWYHASGKCIDDPCLKYNSVCQNVNVEIEGVSTSLFVACTNKTLNALYAGAGQDCNNDGDGKLCVQSNPEKATDLYTYCVYARIKDGSCPASICKEKDDTNSLVAGHCITQYIGGQCTQLSASDCKLTPKCWWNTSSDGLCQEDFCFRDPGVGVACSGITGNGRGNFAAGDCRDFHPLDPVTGAVLNYCIYKDNTKANICYFGTPGSSLDYTLTDYKGDGVGGTTGTYPTYNSSGYGFSEHKPSCTGSGLPQCEGVGECKTIINARGAFAGKYCSDGQHAAGSIVPRASFLVAIILALISLLAV